ncbi:type I pullulanase [Paenibacillus sp. HJL G12]|uniref:Type I pullulanase n=1 Tax=Paenibacillus dendrobii TaxID=2691084 RepID=A0A7X3LIJ2_9BACL|nr:type I pullulanase [Paenibacillus dendrobii]
MAVQKEHDVVVDYGDPATTNGISVFDADFDFFYAYDGDDLGVRYTPEETKFRVWAPTATEVKVLLYPVWACTFAEEMEMVRDTQGTWVLRIEGDYKGIGYKYKVKIGEQWNEAVDPYAVAVGINGDRGAIVDLSATDPSHWIPDKPLLASPVDAVIYELHLRDLSIHPSSGISHPGKYLGLAEEGTKGPKNISTGLDHIRSLGVTHVQLLPVYDYSTESVDESRLDIPQYNWGYDPKNYNVPEGSYATDPYEPSVRITEMKQMIQTLHDKGLRVIMDVVYNHVYDWYLINFTKLVPGYYLRYTSDGALSDGSFCGNEFASERKMARKFIVDSVLHWVKEYHIDGFRFDLMGLTDIETMNEIRRRLDEIDPSIITIGEGWNMSTTLPAEERAIQGNAHLLPGIGQFNDGFRDAVKGSIFIHEHKGFISGASGYENDIRKGVAGGIEYNGKLRQFASEPVQSVNYAECHDNHTMWDKLVLSTEGCTEEERRRMHRLGSAMILTSQGIPFIHAGQEFMRTKSGVENSYRSPDEINWMDWERSAAHWSDVNYMKQLIRFRKEHAGFRLRTAALIREHLVFEEAPAGCVAYTLREHAGGDSAKHLYVLYHARSEETQLKLPALGAWILLFGEEQVQMLNPEGITVSGIGTVVLAVE